MLSVRSQSNPARDRASRGRDLCGALSAGLGLSQLPSRAQSCVPAAAILTAERWEGCKAAQSSSVSAPIPSASLLRAQHPPRSFPRSCFWARQRLSSGSNNEIVIKCFKGEILPFDSCLPFSACSFLPCFAVGFVSCLPGGIGEGAGEASVLLQQPPSPGATSMARRRFCH